MNNTLCRRVACGFAAVSATLVPGACSGTHFSGVVVRVTERNFAIDAPPVIHAGRVRLVVDGAGPTMHELNVSRTDLAKDALPLEADGTVSDKVEHAGITHIGEIEGIDMGGSKALTLTLAPGRYVYYCNMDGHYQAGMSAEFTVAPQ